MNKAIFVAIAGLLIIQLSCYLHETDAELRRSPTYVLAVDNLEFTIVYDSQSRSTRISLIELNEESKTLLVVLDRKEQKEDVLSLSLPRYLIESKVNGTDTALNVLVNGATIVAEQESDYLQHYLRIPLTANAFTVKIIGTETLSVTYDTTTLSIKGCCFWTSTDKTVYFPSEEMILKGNVAKKLASLRPTIDVSRDGEVVSVFDIPEDKFLYDTFFSYSLGFARTFPPGEYDLGMTYGSVSTKTSFSVLAPKILSADYSIITTPFEVSFRNEDFTQLGPSHGILIVKPNETASIHIDVTNKDTYEHGINLSLSTIARHSFEPDILIVKPNSTATALLTIKTSGADTTQWSIINILAKSQTFGAIGKTFYLVVGSNVTESDLYFIDKTIREGLPGAAFPFISRSPEHEAEKLIVNNYGTPGYLPSSYEFQGIDSVSPATVLIYAPVEITNSTEMIDFWRSGGLLIVYSKETSFNRQTWMPDYIAQNEGLQVIINGNFGVVTEQQERVTADGIRYKYPSEVLFFRDDDMVNLRGNMPSDELLKVAASIPFQVNKKFPIIITELELNSSGYDSLDLEAFDCQGLKLTSKQWIEIHNASDRTIDLKDIGIELNQGQTMQNALFQTHPLQPEEYRFVGLASSQLIFPTNKSFALVRFGDYPLRIDSTPVLNDSMPTYKTWQKIDEQWVFWDATPCNALPAKRITLEADGGDFVISVIGTTNIELLELDRESKSLVLLSDSDRIQNVNITLQKALIGGPYSLSMQKEKGIRGVWEVNQNDTHASFFINLPRGETTIMITGTTVIQEFPMQHLTKSTPSGTILVDLYWEPDIIEANKTATFVLAFRYNENNLIKDAQYDILITDAKGNVVLDRKFLATVDGKGTHEVTFESTGNVHVIVTHYLQPKGSLMEPILEKVEFDLMVVPEFPVVWLILIGSFFVVSIYTRYLRRSIC